MSRPSFVSADLIDVQCCDFGYALSGEAGCFAHLNQACGEIHCKSQLRVHALEEIGAAKPPVRSVTQEPGHARRFARDVTGAASRPVNEVNPARSGRLLRSGFGLAASRSVLAAVHPSAPKGLSKVKNEKVKGTSSRYCVTENPPIRSVKSHGVLHAVQA